jgi:predicted nuclease of restriction endonuclease-like (RecB) superfamily
VLLKEIKERVRTAQVHAAFAVSRELILLYWSIGRDILSRQQAEGWGTKGIERLAKDLGAEFPGVEGFSSRNLKYMRSLVEAWPEAEIVPQLLALLPWEHLRVLLDRLSNTRRVIFGPDEPFRRDLGYTFNIFISSNNLGPVQLRALPHGEYLRRFAPVRSR